MPLLIENDCLITVLGANRLVPHFMYCTLQSFSILHISCFHNRHTTSTQFCKGDCEQLLILVAAAGNSTCNICHGFNPTNLNIQKHKIRELLFLTICAFLLLRFNYSNKLSNLPLLGCS